MLYRASQDVVKRLEMHRPRDELQDRLGFGSVHPRRYIHQHQTAHQMRMHVGQHQSSQSAERHASHPFGIGGKLSHDRGDIGG